MTPDTDRTRITDLETLARARFTKLTAAEIELKLVGSPNLEYKDLTAKVQDAA